MISADARIQILDTSIGKSYREPICCIFNRYANMAEYAETSRSIDFRGSNVKIKDYTGWTDLMYIRKYIRVNECGIGFVRLYVQCTNKDIELTVSKDELVPVYDHTMQREGFHGSRKFAYKLCQPQKIPAMVSLRVEGEFNEDPNKFDFWKPDVLVADKTLSEGFAVVTASKFYSANNITLYGCEEIPVDAIKEWGWV